MRLEPTPRPEQVVRVNAKLITSSTILHLSSEELEHAVSQEQAENPALTVKEQRICLFCSAPLYGQYGQVCSACGNFPPQEQPGATNAPPAEGAYPIENHAKWDHQHTFFDIDNYGFIEIDDEDSFDPMARIATNESLSETLLQQLEALLPPEDATIAEQLVGNLNERGYLEITLEEVAQHLEVPLERVDYVLKQLQTLEPLGIGARNLRECLLLQLDAISEIDEVPPLAHTLIDQYLDQIAHNQFHDIARQLKVSEAEVKEVYRYIRTMLHPFPAHTYSASQGNSRVGNGATYIRPDIIIRQGENGLEVELVEEKRYLFSVGSQYTPLSSETPTNEVQRYMHYHNDRARFFIDCMQRRWQTLRRVSELVIHYQREFIEKGVRYLRPLTRTEVATRLSLDEGTVSRATANKYALLPSGRLLPLADFFDGSLGVKDMLRELITTEDPRRRYSDEELARLMKAQGIPMARRTVTKYREEMGIGSSRDRSHMPIPTRYQ
ncbi:RNA polymerase factor sigma-54 [Ktedonospora formicarum]|uniref:RNA polymerase sigma-54 factor n=1 Tax=Ktedonospora formicarum TaxID=2778364 RepID=A0A8J3MRX3_9CHLR|nr:RNA polymerase factor sigma-54 [Ktedonospora formicarum]GHO45475.1 RNA polymerase sigma-54 factor [Ktedonospora formicarum]